MNLVEHIVDRTGATRRQAEGGAGILLRHAQAQLSADDFVRVADAIPAISDLIGKAPRETGVQSGPLRALWQRWFSGWGGLSPLLESFDRLEIDRETAKEFVAVVLDHFSEQGGQEVGQLLFEALA